MPAKYVMNGAFSALLLILIPAKSERALANPGGSLVAAILFTLE